MYIERAFSRRWLLKVTNHAQAPAAPAAAARPPAGREKRNIADAGGHLELKSRNPPAGAIRPL